MLVHEGSDGSGRVRLEVGNGLAEERPAGEAGREVELEPHLVLPLDEDGDEKQSHD